MGIPHEGESLRLSHEGKVGGSRIWVVRSKGELTGVGATDRRPRGGGEWGAARR